MTPEEYRTEIDAAIKTWPWWDRPIVRLALWQVERREGAPNKPPKPRLLRYTIIDRPGNHIHAAFWRGRCTYCGHRVPHQFIAGGWGRHCIECRGREHPYMPIETRRQPWRIPSEMVMRYRAMRRGQ